MPGMPLIASRVNSTCPTTSSSQPPTTTTTMSTTSEASAQLIYPPNVQSNSALLNVKFLSACFAGAAAGILGLENLHGFALFLASTVLTSLCVGVVNCKGRVGKYVHGGWAELVNPGQDNAFSFVLVWTLFYGAFWMLLEVKWGMWADV
ncbi:hypothetical protein CC2G_009948 [Coprinopsis cinerea AmutBmut pab1-1]|nr:hypothetical protein CC2G_009948 [Coprinopsis cinerea AmutBmut pab1-1]